MLAGTMAGFTIKFSKVQKLQVQIGGEKTKNYSCFH